MVFSFKYPTPGIGGIVDKALHLEITLFGVQAD